VGSLIVAKIFGFEPGAIGIEGIPLSPPP